MFSRWAYVLIGNNNTGKTSFQRHLLAALCDVHYKRLETNIVINISHPRAPRKENISIVVAGALADRESG